MFYYDITSSAKKTTSLKTTGTVHEFKWYPFTSNDFAYANHKNEIVFQNITNINKVSNCKVQLSSEIGYVTAMEWYDVDENYKYILVGSSQGKMFLVDLNEDNLCVVNVFEKYGNGSVWGLVWLSYEPGSFIMVNQHSGRYVKYNVSKSTYNAVGNLNVFHVFQIIKFDNESVLFTNVHGDVVVFNVKLNKNVFTITQSHCQTVFDLKINKHLPNIFATCSYDSTIRLWNMTINKAYEIYYLSTCSTALDSSLSSSSSSNSKNKDIPHVICICWAYNDSNLLCSGDTSQTLRVWDTSKHRQVASFKLINNNNNNKENGLNAIHGVDWDKDDNIVCGCYCSIYLFTFKHKNNNSNNSNSNSNNVPTLTNTLIINIGHGIYKLIFNRIDSSFNTAIAPCNDGVIRIYNLKYNDSNAFQELKGHKHAVYAVALHKTKKLLASSSNDFRIGIWDMKVTDQEIKAKFLLGHTDNVRQVIWLEHSAHSILLSGSWDSSIRCWNVDQMICVGIITEHQSDVYGIDISPKCGYLLISTSKDNTIRFWNYMKGCALSKLIAFDDNAVTFQDKVKQAAVIAKEYLYEEHIDKLFSVLEYYDNEKCEVFVKEYVNYVNELLSENALRKEKNGKFEYNVKKENVIEMLIQKAQKSGQWKLYCELCVEINKWEDAIMASPHVSKEYWKHLTYKYSCYCNSNSNSNTSTNTDKLFSSLVSDDMEHAMNYLLSREEYEDAKLIWLTRHKCVHDNNNNNNNNNNNSIISNNTHFTPSQNDEHILTSLINKHSIHCLLTGSPLSATTSWLMLHNSFNAIKTCIQSIQYEIAYMLMRITNNNTFNNEILSGLFTIRRNSPLKALIDLISLSTDPYNTVILLSKVNRANEMQQQHTNNEHQSDVKLIQAFVKKDCEYLIKCLHVVMNTIVNDIVNNISINETDYLQSITILLLIKGIDVYVSCTNYNEIICDVLYMAVLLEVIHDNYKSVICLMKELLGNKVFIKGNSCNNSSDVMLAKAKILSIVNSYINKSKEGNGCAIVNEYTLTENEIASMNIKLVNTSSNSNSNNNNNSCDVNINTITLQLENSSNDLCRKYICDSYMKYYYFIKSELFPHNLSNSTSLQTSSFSMNILKPKHHIKLHSKRLCTISEYFEITKFIKL